VAESVVVKGGGLRRCGCNILKYFDIFKFMMGFGVSG
jgi:hypothetical protein